MKSKFASNFARGAAIGSSMLIPGVSGGTTAIILGCYDSLIHAVSTFTQNKKKNSLLLLQYLLGGILGMLLFSGVLLKAVNAAPMVMMYLFLGAIAGSLPMLYRKSQIKRPSFKDGITVLFGYLSVKIIELLPQEYLNIGSLSGALGLVIIFAAGIIISIALVLPGISASHMLLMLGIYDTTLSAVSSLDIAFLMPLGLSVLAGVFLTSKILEKAMSSNPQATYLLITGFVLGSLSDVFPGLPAGYDILCCLLSFGAGFAVILWLSKLENR